MERRSQEPGLMLFIKRKLENSVPLREVKEMLLRAGFTEKQIDEALQEVHNRFPDTHQDIVAGNSFLPPLQQKDKVVVSDIKPKATAPAVSPAPAKKPVAPMPKITADAWQKNSPSIFAGRLRRHDFILGFLFFFGAGMVVLSTILGFFTFFFPNFIQFTNDLVADGFYGFWSFILPVLITPITVMLLSTLWRRLHDISLPGVISLGFLVFFINPVNDIFSFYGIIALQAMMAVIFVVLVAKKGDAFENKYGEPTELKGSTFARVFNIR